MPSHPSSSFLLIESCLKCEHREGGLFCHLPNHALLELMNAREGRVYPRNALIFQQGQAAKGVFVLCSGKARLSATTPEGETTVLREAGPGEILGVSAMLGGSPYKTTAEVLEQCQLNFIEKNEFLKLLRENDVIGSRVAEQLLYESGHACSEQALLQVSGTLHERLAQLLLHWARHPMHVLKRKRDEVPFRVTASHDEIAQMTGSTAGDVAAALQEFLRKKWLSIDGATWSIRKSAVERIARPARPDKKKVTEKDHSLT